MRKLLWLAGCTVSIVIVGFFAVAYYWSSEYVDETITNGTRWGVSIGSTPEEVLVDLKTELVAHEARVMRSPGRTAKWEHLGDLSEIDASDVRGVEQLTVLWEGDAVSDLTLTFESDRLTSAHMQRRAFELP